MFVVLSVMYRQEGCLRCALRVGRRRKKVAMDHIQYVNTRNILLNNGEILLELESNYKNTLEKTYDLLNTGTSYPEGAFHDFALEKFKELLCKKELNINEYKK